MFRLLHITFQKNIFVFGSALAPEDPPPCGEARVPLTVLVVAGKVCSEWQEAPDDTRAILAMLCSFELPPSAPCPCFISFSSNKVVVNLSRAWISSARSYDHRYPLLVRSRQRNTRPRKDGFTPLFCAARFARWLLVSSVKQLCRIVTNPPRSAVDSSFS